ncbi:MAG: DNA repair protein RecO [Armatimonadetes bacterium]|nr:DNA repair protein RecO [Armatimonadota bacterium]
MRHTRLYRGDAVVLRQRNLAEADRILVLYTRPRGKLSAVAKGIRRPRSKLAGSLQLFAHAHIQLAAGRSLDVITQAEAIDLYYHLRQEVDRYAHACYVVELLDTLVDEGLPDEDLFSLLTGTLHGMDAGGDPATLTRAFEVKLLSRLGYGPELDACVSCGEPLRDNAAGFSVTQGGVVCERCAKNQGAVRLSRGACRAMKDLRRIDMDQLATRRLSPAIKGELAQVLRGFVDYHLDRPLRSTAFLSEEMNEACER